MVGNSVWVVEFLDKDFIFCDCNGVYASREKAIAAVENDFRLNEGLWTNRTVLFDTKSVRCEIFHCEELEVEICMYERFIQ